MSYELSCIVRLNAVGCVACAATTVWDAQARWAGAQAVSVWDAGQLVRRMAEMNFLQRGADADTTGVVYFG
jgi:hypothetical protein